MNFDELRACLAQPIANLKDAGTCAMLPELCAELGLPAHPDEGSKAQRISASFDAVQDYELGSVAEKFLAVRKPAAALRNEIQDLLWANSGVPEISKRVRREVAQALYSFDLYLNRKGFDELLDELWILDEIEWKSFLTAAPTLRDLIERHVHSNPEDWPAEMLFEKLGALEASDRRFALFLEGLASGDVRPDDASQRAFVAVVNGALQGEGLELQEIGTAHGYASFTLVMKHNSAIGRPKTLIFASPVKPDLRFRDVVTSEIEIVTNADKVLVYDRAIGSTGLTWSDLQSWWADSKNIACEREAKASLYMRLCQSLPDNSPPQALFFDAYHRSFKSAIPSLPALLPEVWLHWDPRSVRERGQDALARSRMDFLLLLPYGVRVVLEIDGKQHYSDERGRASPSAYAAMVGADRELKLAGYHVFRFGAAELDGESGRELVKEFFDRLFARFSISVAASPA